MKKFLLIVLLLSIRQINAQICFSPAVSYSAGTSPWSLCTADFNGDAKADLAVANYYSGNVSIFIGTGIGTFGTATNFTAAGPVSITSSDFNGDGFVDLAVAIPGNLGKAGIMLGTGTGSFGTCTYFTAGNKPSSIVSADFNNDGFKDLAVANQNSNDISIFIGTGTGSFGAAINFPGGTNACGITSGDFNNDGNIDLATANYITAGTTSILLGTGTGSFGTATNFSTSGTVPTYVTSADFNGDGFADLAGANHSGSFAFVLLNTGTGSFATATLYGTGSNPSSVISADFDGDTKLDIAVANYNSNTVSVLSGIGNGNFNSAINFYSGSSGPNGVVAADFNGDGKTDIALSSEITNNATVLLNGLSVSINGNVNICTASTTTLTASGASTYTWNTGSTSSSIVVSPTVTTSYTLTGANGVGCTNVSNTTVTVNKCVWPGDADENLIVDNIDLLSIGIEYGKTGPARTTQGNTWQKDYCSNWTDTLSNGKNIKYTDCNGDGTINMNDTLAINLNYGLTHIARMGSQQIIQTTNPDIYLQFNKSQYAPGDTVIASVYIGSNTVPQTDFYGAAFNLTYDKTKVQVGTEKFWFNNSWVGNINQSKIKFKKINTGTGIVDASLVRITHTDTTGFGKVATLQFILKTPLVNSELYFTINNAIKTDSAGNISPLNTGTDSTSIVNNTASINPFNNDQAIIYPNPTTGKFVIESSTAEKQAIQILDLNGRIVLSQTISGLTNIDAANLCEGIYTLMIKSDDSVINKKLIIIHQ